MQKTYRQIFELMFELKVRERQTAALDEFLTEVLDERMPDPAERAAFEARIKERLDEEYQAVKDTTEEFLRKEEAARRPRGPLQ
jgi:hypothetical protein